MNISYFHSRVNGPELVLEDIVAKSIEKIAPKTNLSCWAAGSPRVGAGMPDLLFATFKPEVYALSTLKYSNMQVLAFLRAVNGADLDTLMVRLKYTERILATFLEEFIGIDAVENINGVYSLSKPWINILPTIITIEVKVQDWRKAVLQANRNKIYSHQSFIALPKKTAMRIKDDQIFNQTGVGLLSIEEESVEKISEAQTTLPQIWDYYYKLASLIARRESEGENAIYRSDRTSQNTLSGI